MKFAGLWSGLGSLLGVECGLLPPCSSHPEARPAPCTPVVSGGKGGSFPPKQVFKRGEANPLPKTPLFLHQDRAPW